MIGYGIKIPVAAFLPKIRSGIAVQVVKYTVNDGDIQRPHSTVMYVRMIMTVKTQPRW
jgi:hypothetical protein